MKYRQASEEDADTTEPQMEVPTKSAKRRKTKDLKKGCWYELAAARFAIASERRDQD